MIELLVAVFLIGTVITGLFSLFSLTLRVTQQAERRVVALALANERAEMIRNLPYRDVGTVGGIPAGSIVPEEDIVRDSLTYHVSTDIRYIDDPFDGTAGGTPPDDLNTDYKQARVEVSWVSPTRFRPIVLIVVVAPPGLEGGEPAGTLDFQALDTAGNAVSAAIVQLTNISVEPPISISTRTNDDGKVTLPGLPESPATYQLLVAKAGYTTEQTYDITASFIPDADHSHLSMFRGQVTEKTFFIDQLSSLSVITQDDKKKAKPIGNVTYILKGSRTIGVDGQGNNVRLVELSRRTDGNGVENHSALPWDTYEFIIDGQEAGYDVKETNLLLPLVINPADNLSLAVTLVPHTPVSLHVTVTSPTGDPVDNATVRLADQGIDQTLGSGPVGQVFFPDLPVNADYTLTIDAPSYELVTQTVTVANTTRARIVLVPRSQ